MREASGVVQVVVRDEDVAHSLRSEYCLKVTGEVVARKAGNENPNLATGDVEEEIDDLRKEARDIHTPEQQRFVITKIVRLLERLIILRHNPGYVQQKFHDSVSWFTRVIGRDDGAKELQTRIGEAIRDLAKLRDEVLAKKWNDEKYNEEVDNLKKKVADLLDAAASRKAEDLE